MMTNKNIEHCPLCGDKGRVFYSGKNRIYYNCSSCFSVFLKKSHLPEKPDELKRYDLHKNDINDPGYRDYVRPLVEEVLNSYGPQHSGLDFGAGPGPVVSAMLEEREYNIKKYDPFYHDYPDLLNFRYDYIICCEVVEHFHNPEKEFRLLRDLLLPGGSLFCSTVLFDPEKIDFAKWYYREDTTHVFFYREETFTWIKECFRFDRVNVRGRLAILSLMNTFSDTESKQHKYTKTIN